MSRIGITPKIRDLAQRLISLEVVAENLSKTKIPAAFIVSEKLPSVKHISRNRRISLALHARSDFGKARSVDS